ncbi:MAG: ferredoxin [bacterium ADurb.Bin429]|nr:MAG: ferredoxin [bacterium ADurb.Bin429]
MQIAIASGKGGTGKTTLAVNMARLLSRHESVQYVDCDVEEPNGHLFLHPAITQTTSVTIPVPEVNAERCILCGACSRLCQYHAIAALPALTMVFPELCHGCGGCLRVCPEKAITEVGRPIGVVERGMAGIVAFVHGRLNIGEAMSPPLIRAVQTYADPHATVILDAPPGTSCPVIAAIRPCDVVVLVTEPTAFGLHDLTLAVEMVRALNRPMGVVINRADIGDDRVELFCEQEGIPIWGRIPHDRRIAEAYARGEMAVDVLPDTIPCFTAIMAAIRSEAPV